MRLGWVYWVLWTCVSLVWLIGVMDWSREAAAIFVAVIIGLVENTGEITRRVVEWLERRDGPDD